MNFSRTHRDASPEGLSLDQPNNEGTISTSIALPVGSYKYLGVLFDLKLRWSLQHAKVLATATFWLSKLWHVSKQLYNTVAVPRFTYGMEVWYCYGTGWIFVSKYKIF